MKLIKVRTMDKAAGQLVRKKYNKRTNEDEYEYKTEEGRYLVSFLLNEGTYRLKILESVNPDFNVSYWSLHPSYHGTLESAQRAAEYTLKQQAKKIKNLNNTSGFKYWEKQGFPHGFTMSFDVYQKDLDRKGKVVVTGKASPRSTEGFLLYDLQADSTFASPGYVWDFKSIQYRPYYNEWMFGRGAEKKDDFSGYTPKKALQWMLEWQSNHNNWEDRVTNRKISFS